MNTITATAAVPNDPGAVSWGAVIAGAVGAAALSLVLLLLGTGLGLAIVSPWASRAVSEEALGMSTILWVTVVQLLASALGGYLAGRLRSRWTTIHTNEVYFRDTAHGFLAWSVATLLMATVLSSAIGTAIGLGLDPDAATETAKQTDEARKAAALASLWLVVSLFVGAFISAWAATFGGRLRDKSVLNLT
jgi:heme/copper-type cytochrome/quinol oxidase subunit 2